MEQITSLSLASSNQAVNIDQLCKLLADQISQRLNTRSIERGEFSPNGQLLFSCDEDGVLKVESLTSRANPKKLGEIVNQGKIEISNNNKEVCWPTKDGNLTYRSVDAGVSGGRFKGKWHEGYTFSDDNKYLMVPKLAKDKQARQNWEKWERRKNELQASVTQSQKKYDGLLEELSTLKAKGDKRKESLDDLWKISNVALLAAPMVTTGPAMAASLMVKGGGHLVELAMQSSFDLKEGEVSTAKNNLEKANADLAAHNAQEPSDGGAYPKATLQFVSMETQRIDLEKERMFETKKEVSSIAISGDKKHFFTVEEDAENKIIKRWSIETGEREETFGTDEFEEGPTSIRNIVPSWSGGQLAVVNIKRDEASVNPAMQYQVWLYSLVNEPQLESQFEMTVKDVFNLTFSPNEKWLAAVNAEGQILIFSTELGISQIMENIESEPIHTLGWDQENRLHTAGSGNDRKPRTWNVITSDDSQFTLSEYVAPSSGQSTPEAFTHVA